MYCGVSKYIVACTMLCIFLCGCAVWPNTCMVAKRKSRRRQVSSTMPADGPKQEQSVTALRGQPRQTRLELMPGSVARGHQNTPRNLAARLPWGLAPWARFPLFGYPLWGSVDQRQQAASCSKHICIFFAKRSRFLLIPFVPAPRQSL